MKACPQALLAFFFPLFVFLFFSFPFFPLFFLFLSSFFLLFLHFFSFFFYLPKPSAEAADNTFGLSQTPADKRPGLHKMSRELQICVL